MGLVVSIFAPRESSGVTLRNTSDCTVDVQYYFLTQWRTCTGSWDFGVRMQGSLVHLSPHQSLDIGWWTTCTPDNFTCPGQYGCEEAYACVVYRIASPPIGPIVVDSDTFGYDATVTVDCDGNASVSGYGMDGNDGPTGPGCAGPDCCHTEGGPGSGGPGGGGSGDGGVGLGVGEGDSGMAFWRVTEPFINLWLVDKPLRYQPAKGPAVALKLFYGQRELKTGYDSHVFGFGKNWNSSWLSYVTTLHNGIYNKVFKTVYFPGGGRLTFQNGDEDKVGHTRLSGNTTTGFTLTYPDGSKNFYGLIVTNASGTFLKAFMSERWNAIGQKTRLDYDGYDPANPVIRLKYVVDGDGLTNWIYYVTSNAYSTNLVSQVVDPFGRTVNFAYDGQGRLTNVVDVVGISSSLLYDNQGFVTNLATPYGATQFQYTDTTGTNLPPYGRSVRVLEPVGSCQLFLYTNGAPGIPASYSSSEVPTTSPYANNFDNSQMNVRNTFHWGRQQYASLSTTNIGSLTTNDFRIAHLNHWLLAGLVGTNIRVSPTLSLERVPSVDGTIEGQKYWFDYAGKTNSLYQGTEGLPLFSATVLPDGATEFTRTARNSLGAVTNRADTYSAGSGVGLRTNISVYASDEIDLLRVTNALGVQVVSNAYNAYHQVVTNFDALGQKTVYSYDTSHRLTSANLASGLVISNLYGADGFLSQRIRVGIATNTYTWANDLVATHTDARGLTLTYTWDNLNRVRRVDFPDGTTITNSYDKLDLARVVDRMGFATAYGYDALRRRVAETNANGVVSRYGYCSCGSLTYVTNTWGTPAQFVTQNIFDLQGNPVYQIYPDVTVTNWFDALGRKTVTGRGWGYRWLYYNHQGLLTNISNAYGAEQTVTYDILDRPLYVKDENGVTVTNAFDNLGRLRTRTYPDGGVERFGWSARGLVAYTNQLDKTNYYGYDAAGRRVAETNANGEVIRYTNNAAGDLVALVDGKGQVTKWGYDEYGRATNKLDQAGAEILRYRYDPDGRLTNRWSAAKGDTKYKYDPVGNRTNVDYPVSPDLAFQFDWLNRLTNMVDAAGTTKFTYTAGGQLLGEDGPLADDTVTSVYSNGLRTGWTLQQPNDVWWNSFGYDSARRLVGVASPAGTFGYSFLTGASPLVSYLSLPNGSHIEKAYDNVARLRSTKLLDSGSSVLDSSAYGYNAASQRVAFTNAAGTWVNNRYDRIGQLAVADSSVNSEDRGYSYDAAWNLNYRTSNGSLQTFNVDGKNQLTTTPDGACAYDANGNLTNAAGAVCLYDDENRLVEWRQASGPVAGALATTFVYDGLGRLRARGEFQGNGSYWGMLSVVNYLYDGRRVIEERDGDNVPQVAYTRGTDLSGSLEGAGGIGGLLARSHGFTNCSTTLTVRITNDTAYCLYDLVIWDDYNTYVSGASIGSGNYGEYSFPGLAGRTYHAFAYSCDYYYIQVFYDEWSGTLETHAVDFLGEEGSIVTESGNPLCDGGSSWLWLTHNYYHADGNGNITAMTAANQTLTASYRYDPFGNITSQSGGLADANLYRFSSKELHVNSGLYDYGERWYGPSWQRWLSRDPLGESEGINLYAYCGNDPVSEVDPFGMEWLPFSNKYYGKPKFGSDKPEPMFLYVWVESNADYERAVEFTGDNSIDAVAGSGGGLRNAGKMVKPALGACKNALRKVWEKVGKLRKGKPGKFGSPQRGDTTKGYRMDPGHPPSEKHPPGSEGTKPHFDWWNYEDHGKGHGPPHDGTIPIE